ncbi:Lysine methyltransferase [Pleurotus pulmonarius]
MFKFNFDVEGTDMDPTILGPLLEPSSNSSSSAAGTMQTFRELTLNELLDALPDMISYSPLSFPLSSGRDLTLVRRDLFDARFQLISEAEEDPDEETSKREKISESSLKFVDSPSDLVPGVYEGGLKTWECALDLVDYLENSGARSPTGKVILELGCGTAIPSIYLLERLFAQPPTNTGLPMTHIHLQDYNDAVLQLVTLPNILLNWYMSPASISFRQSITSSEVSFPPVDSTAPGELPITSELVAAFQDSLLAFNISLRFFTGSWETFDLQQSLSLTKEANRDRTYDMVLTSETIYRVESLSALIELMRKSVGQHEYQCLVAAKILYFGVGGGVSEFVARVEGQSGRVETVWEKSAGVGRKIMQVHWP